MLWEPTILIIVSAQPMKFTDFKIKYFYRIAKQKIQMKYQALFSLKNPKTIRMSLAPVVIPALTFTTLWAISADDKFVIFFLIFPRKQKLTLHWRQFA